MIPNTLITVETPAGCELVRRGNPSRYPRWQLISMKWRTNERRYFDVNTNSYCYVNAFYSQAFQIVEYCNKYGTQDTFILYFCNFFKNSKRLFGLFMVLRPTREFFTHSETSPLPVKGSNFELCSALMAIEQWGFISVPQFIMVISEDLWHTPVAKHLAVELSLPVFKT